MAHMQSRGVCEEMKLFGLPICKLIKPNIKTIFFDARPSSSKFVVCGAKKSQRRSSNHGVQASTRRDFVHVLAVFGAMVCESRSLGDGLARAAEEESSREEALSDGEVVLQGVPHTVRLARPNRSSFQRDELEEVLSVKLKVLRTKASAFRVFINLPDADVQTPITIPHYASFYIHEARRPGSEYQEVTFLTGIGEIVKDLGLTGQPSLFVTFVPCGKDKAFPIVLKNLHIESL